MNKGDIYASDFVSVETDRSAPDEQKRWVDLPIKEGTDPSSVTVYHSKDAKTWEPAEVQDLSEDKHLARVKIKSGKGYTSIKMHPNLYYHCCISRSPATNTSQLDRDR